MIFIRGPIIYDLLRSLVLGALNWQGLWAKPYEAEVNVLLVLTSPAVVFAIGRLISIGDDDFLQQFLALTLEARTS